MALEDPVLGDELPQLPPAHEVKVKPRAVFCHGQDLEGLPRARLQVRQPVGVVHHDVEDGPVPRHEVLLRRPQERLQVPVRSPAKHGRGSCVSRSFGRTCVRRVGRCAPGVRGQVGSSRLHSLETGLS